MGWVAIYIFNIQQTNQNEQQIVQPQPPSPVTHNQHPSLSSRLLIRTTAARPFWLTAGHALNPYELPQDQQKITRRDHCQVILSQELNTTGQLEAPGLVSRHVGNLQQNATSLRGDSPPKPKN